MKVNPNSIFSTTNGPNLMDYPRPYLNGITRPDKLRKNITLSKKEPNILMKDYANT